MSEWWQVEPNSCDSCVLLAPENLTPEMLRAIPDVVSALKPGANVVGIATLDAYAELAARAEDCGLEVRDCALVVAATGLQVALLARKPLEGTVARNVLAYGVGGLNIDAGRIGRDEGDVSVAGHRTATFGTQETKGGGDGSGGWVQSAGRWPANLMFQHSEWCTRKKETHAEVIGGGKAGTSGFADGYKSGDGFDGRVIESAVWDCHSDCPVETLDEQSGVSKSTGGSGLRSGLLDGEIYGAFSGQNNGRNAGGLGDTGGASRYFYSWECYKDCPVGILDEQSGERKSTGTPDRPATKGVTHNTNNTLSSVGVGYQGTLYSDTGGASRFFYAAQSLLPLLTYLCCLVTPEGGAILDPFNNPYTRIAAEAQGFRFEGITKC